MQLADTMELSQSLSDGNSSIQLPDSWYREFLADIQRHADKSYQCDCGREGIYVPQAQFKPQKWDRVDGVPVGALIEFSTGTNRAIPILDALERKLSDMVGRDDPVFEEITARTCVLCIDWPAYDTRKYEIKTKEVSKNAKETNSSRDVKPVTRERLAFDIAKRVQAYVKEMQAVSIDRNHAEWQLGRGNITVDRIMLVFVERMSQGTWKAHLHVVDRDF